MEEFEFFNRRVYRSLFFAVRGQSPGGGGLTAELCARHTWQPLLKSGGERCLLTREGIDPRAAEQFHDSPYACVPIRMLATANILQAPSRL